MMFLLKWAFIGKDLFSTPSSFCGLIVGVLTVFLAIFKDIIPNLFPKK